MDKFGTKILQRKYPKDPVIRLLSLIGWGLTNYDPRYPKKQNNILIVGPEISTMFGLKIEDDEVSFAVPEPVFEAMKRVGWYVATVCQGMPGIYLSLSTGRPKPHNIMIIRLHARSSFVKVMMHYDFLTVKMMSEQGDDMSWMAGCSFRLPLKKLTAPDWVKN